MSESFHRVLFPGTARVLGMRLPALSLWSLSVMQALECPFLCGDPERRITLPDLQVAVRCALTTVLQPPDLRPRLRDLALRLRHGRDRGFLERHAAAFVAWLEAHQQVPELWDREDEGEPRYISAPLPLSQVAGLMKLGMTHTEAWGTSPGYASWLILANAERECSGVRFANAADEEVTVPDLPESEDELRALARANLDPAGYESWLEARVKNALQGKEVSDA